MRLDIGCAADLVVLNWPTVTWPWQDPDTPLVDVLIRRARTGAVESVMVDGDVVYHQGHFTRVARDSVLEEIAETMALPRSEADHTRRHLARALIAHVQNFYSNKC